tara:strand:+ start:2280 stop:2483 length:204 start_codon:yes stop_codon:yes gene_type:complete
MANNINWGEVYCDILTNNAFGDSDWSANAINDISAPTCWAGGVLPFTADTTLYTADTTLYTADQTQL